MDEEIVGKITGAKYRISPFTFGDRNAILDETNIVDSAGNIHLMAGSIRRMKLKLAIKSPKLTDEEIDALPEEEALQILTAIENINVTPLGPSPRPSSSTPEKETPKTTSEESSGSSREGRTKRS